MIILSSNKKDEYWRYRKVNWDKYEGLLKEM